MRLRGLLVPSLGLVFLLAVPAPALAKGDLEFVISGGDLTHHLTITSAQINRAVHGSVWKSADPPPPISGPGYEMLFFMKAPQEDRRYYMSTWMYYPAAGGALIIDNAIEEGPGSATHWERFSPEFRELINAKIGWDPQRGRPDPATQAKGNGASEAAMALGIIVVIASILGAWIRGAARAARLT